MQTKLVIFDNDGVLVDSEVIIKDALVDAYAAQSIAIEREWAFKHLQGLSSRDNALAVQEFSGQPVDADLMIDIIFTFLNISGPVCAKVNEILIGDDTVPVETLPPRNTFSEPEGGNSDLTATNCASCEGRYHFCAQDNQVAGVRAFYNIIASE